jgi:hypothetical protein
MTTPRKVKNSPSPDSRMPIPALTPDQQASKLEIHTLVVIEEAHMARSRQGPVERLGSGCNEAGHHVAIGKASPSSTRVFSSLF